MTKFRVETKDGVDETEKRLADFSSPAEIFEWAVEQFALNRIIRKENLLLHIRAPIDAEGVMAWDIMDLTNNSVIFFDGIDGWEDFMEACGSDSTILQIETMQRTSEIATPAARRREFRKSMANPGGAKVIEEETRVEVGMEADLVRLNAMREIKPAVAGVESEIFAAAAQSPDSAAAARNGEDVVKASNISNLGVRRK